MEAGGERKNLAAEIGPAVRYPRRRHGWAHRRCRLGAYGAWFDEPETRGERGEDGDLTGKLSTGGEGVATTANAGWCTAALTAIEAAQRTLCEAKTLLQGGIEMRHSLAAYL